MGNACCVAARDKMVIPNSSSSVGGENLRRRSNSNLRHHSPNWSFRWDHNRGRVAGEETTSLSWLSNDGTISRNDGSEIKFNSAFVSNASSEGSPLDSFRTHHTLQKSPASDLSFPRNSSMGTVFEQKENDSTENPATQLSLSLASQPSSFVTSPLSSQSYLNPSSSSTLKPIYRSRLSNQVSETDSASQCGTTSENWSLQAFSEMMSSSSHNNNDESLSYDNHSFGLQRDKNRISSSCGACSRPLSEKSSWSNNGQKSFITSNELAVSAILACGHVYHGECLEQMTQEIDKFDPLCPICTLGEKKTMKISEKALKADMEMKARRRNKRLRNRVLDSEFDCDNDDDGFVMFDHNSHMTGVVAGGGKNPKLVASSSVKPFLARHFSFGSRSHCKSSPKDNGSVRKKGFFWTKSSKI